MHDSSWAGEDDRCAENPVHCDEGLSFSIWEKITYDSNVLVDRDNRVQERKYIVSSGGDYDPVAGTGMEEITCAMRAFQLWDKLLSIFSSTERFVGITHSKWVIWDRL